MNRFSAQQNGIINSFFFFFWRLLRFGKELLIYTYIIYIDVINGRVSCVRARHHFCDVTFRDVWWGYDDDHKLQPIQNQNQTQTQTQGGGPPGWMWSGRCGCVSVCLRTLLHLGTLCRRTESQQAGPDTLLLWWSEGGGDGCDVLLLLYQTEYLPSSSQ